MIKHHRFIFTPGLWIGEGTIKLSLVQEDLLFSTTWNSASLDAGGLIESIQQIRIHGVAEPVYNQVTIFDYAHHRFQVELQSMALGKLLGKGIVSETKIAWEFKSEEIGFEGIEIYEKQHDNRYQLYAEYATEEDLRTVIKGVIWQPIS
ncbi:MAG: hypothetical protein QRY72_04380 [Candidatus Rhabdochlamydia sp.]